MRLKGRLWKSGTIVKKERVQIEWDKLIEKICLFIGIEGVLTIVCDLNSQRDLGMGGFSEFNDVVWYMSLSSGDLVTIFFY